MNIRINNLKHIMALTLLLYITASVLLVTLYGVSIPIAVAFCLGLCILEIYSYSISSKQKEQFFKEAQTLSNLVIRNELHKKEVSKKIHKDLGQNLVALKLYLNMPSSSSTGLELVKEKTQKILDSSFKAQKEIEDSLRGTDIDLLGLNFSLENILPGKITVKNSLLEEQIKNEVFTPLYLFFQELVSSLKKGNTINHLFITPLNKKRKISIDVEVSECRLGSKRIEKLLNGSRELQEWLLVLNAQIQVRYLSEKQTSIKLIFKGNQVREEV
ncbi:MAG: hypothetical protein CMJ16_05405 [Peredibacter sp.]|nr:hypothetical protein [Peredibacter sp.]